jgi:hypothetical protein
VTEYVSTKTFLVLSRDTAETHAGGEVVSVSEFFSDYRSIDGAVMPFTSAYNVTGTGEATARVKDVKFDAPLPADVFRARARK